MTPSTLRDSPLILVPKLRFGNACPRNSVSRLGRDSKRSFEDRRSQVPLESVREFINDPRWLLFVRWSSRAAGCNATAPDRRRSQPAIGCEEFPDAFKQSL